jgi:hypothetical protein
MEYEYWKPGALGSLDERKEHMYDRPHYTRQMAVDEMKRLGKTE